MKVFFHEYDPYFFDANETTKDMSSIDRILMMHNTQSPYNTNEHELKVKDRDYNYLRPYFGWDTMDTVKRTIENTTQYTRMPVSTHLKTRYKSPFPALNVLHRNESVATDTIYADTPAIDDGSISAQIFVGTDTLVTDAYGMKTDKQFVNTLEDNIRRRGAPSRLLSDRAQVEISKKVVDILRALCIGDWQSEPHKQHQNPAERRIQTVKNMVNRIMIELGHQHTHGCYVYYILVSYLILWQCHKEIIWFH